MDMFLKDINLMMSHYRPFSRQALCCYQTAFPFQTKGCVVLSSKEAPWERRFPWRHLLNLNDLLRAWEEAWRVNTPRTQKPLFWKAAGVAAEFCFQLAAPFQGPGFEKVPTTSPGQRREACKRLALLSWALP